MEKFKKKKKGSQNGEISGVPDKSMKKNKSIKCFHNALKKNNAAADKLRNKNGGNNCP